MFRLISGAVFVALFASPVQAQEPSAQYSAEAIREHFEAVKSGGDSPLCPGPACLDKGVTRGICFGTVDQCGTGDGAGTEPTAGAPDPGFNLLITFRLGSDDLSEQAKSNLREFARALADPGLAEAKFRIEGHTDARGSVEFNDALSLRRANAVVAFLTGLGVDAARLKAVGYGERALYTPDDPEADINRRVEAALLD